MNRLTSEELQAIRVRAEKASEGPWRLADTADGAWLLDGADMIIAGTFERLEDAIFSAHAREDIPKLLAEIERLCTGIERAINETSCDDTWDYLNRLLEGKETTDLPYRIGGDSE